MTKDQYIITTESGEKFIDGDALNMMTQTIDGVPGKLAGTERTLDNSLMYGAYYQFSTWGNQHNDVCFSLRFVNPQNARNPDRYGADVDNNIGKRFYIESEAKNREPVENLKLLEESGGWIGLAPGTRVPILVRGILGVDAFPEAFTVAEPPFTDWQNGQATSNENIVAEEKVIAGEGTVTIINTAGKHVVISNLLGQTIFSKTLTNDNEVVKAPKGLVMVTIDRNKSFKLVVK